MMSSFPPPVPQAQSPPPAADQDPISFVLSNLLHDVRDCTSRQLHRNAVWRDAQLACILKEDWKTVVKRPQNGQLDCDVTEVLERHVVRVQDRLLSKEGARRDVYAGKLGESAPLPEFPALSGGKDRVVSSSLLGAELFRGKEEQHAARIVPPGSPQVVQQQPTTTMQPGNINATGSGAGSPAGKVLEGAQTAAKELCSIRGSLQTTCASGATLLHTASSGATLGHSRQQHLGSTTLPRTRGTLLRPPTPIEQMAGASLGPSSSASDKNGSSPNSSQTTNTGDPTAPSQSDCADVVMTEAPATELLEPGPAGVGGMVSSPGAGGSPTLKSLRTPQSSVSDRVKAFETRITEIQSSAVRLKPTIKTIVEEDEFLQGVGNRYRHSP